VLLYVASGDPAKADRAEELIGAGGTISVQVLNQMTNASTFTKRASRSQSATGCRPGMPRSASALHADCDTLWSEDMQDGSLLDYRVRIVNPFRAF
jgi:predicted nucleic acid-binding protein